MAEAASRAYELPLALALRPPLPFALVSPSCCIQASSATASYGPRLCRSICKVHFATPRQLCEFKASAAAPRVQTAFPACSCTERWHEPTLQTPCLRKSGCELLKCRRKRRTADSRVCQAPAQRRCDCSVSASPHTKAPLRCLLSPNPLVGQTLRRSNSVSIVRVLRPADAESGIATRKL